MDWEALCVSFELEKFPRCIYSRKVKIYTDHKLLVGLFDNKRPIPKMLWLLLLYISIIIAIGIIHTSPIFYAPHASVLVAVLAGRHSEGDKGKSKNAVNHALIGYCLHHFCKCRASLLFHDLNGSRHCSHWTVTFFMTLASSTGCYHIRFASGGANSSFPFFMSSLITILAHWYF